MDSFPNRALLSLPSSKSSWASIEYLKYLLSSNILLPFLQIVCVRSYDEYDTKSIPIATLIGCMRRQHSPFWRPWLEILIRNSDAKDLSWPFLIWVKVLLTLHISLRNTGCKHSRSTSFWQFSALIFAGFTFYPKIFNCQWISWQAKVQDLVFVISRPFAVYCICLGHMMKMILKVFQLRP